MKQLLLVGLGGFFGSALRFKGGEWMLHRYPSRFPVGTLTVNLVGCLLIGLLMGLAGRRSALSPESRLLLITGFLGGFTTFSAFGLETVSLMRRGRWALALLNVVLSVAGGLLLVWVGLRASPLSEPTAAEQAAEP